MFNTSRPSRFFILAQEGGVDVLYKVLYAAHGGSATRTNPRPNPFVYQFDRERYAFAYLSKAGVNMNLMKF